MGILLLATPLKRMFPLSPTTINFLQVIRQGRGCVTYLPSSHSYVCLLHGITAIGDLRTYHLLLSNPDTGSPAELRFSSPGLCIQRRGFPAGPPQSFPQLTGSHWLALFLPSSVQSSVTETLTARVGKQYFSSQLAN